MNRSRRQQKIKRATAHKKQQRERLVAALAESITAAKKAKKGAKGIITQMEKRGYKPKDDGWKRMPKTVEVEA